MNNNEIFMHDTDCFVSHLTDMESGKKQVSGATLPPHELVRQAIDYAESFRPVYNDNSLQCVIYERERRLVEPQTRVVEAQ